MIRSIDKKPAGPAIRGLWLKAHRYCALGLGWLLALTALLGALLTVTKPMDRWLHPELFTAPAVGAPVPALLQAAREALAREFGPQATLTFRPPRLPQESLSVRVAGPWDGTVYFDPASARELGRRGEHEGFYNLLFELHSSLLLGDTGKAVLALAAATYLLLLLTGLVLWWPRRWPPSLRIRWEARDRKTLFDLHSVGGAVLGVLIAVSVASGAYMAWPPLRPLVSSLFGEKPAPPPKFSARDSAGAAPVALDTLVARAQAPFPGAMAGYVIAAGDASRLVRVRLKLPDDAHPNGLTSVWLHPSTGATLATYRWDRLDAGHKAVSVIYPLHIGALGGPAHTVVTALSGLVLSTLGATGLLLWWKRRRASATKKRPAGRLSGTPPARG
jgi:uncharacterized iron-regulated membrane protein